MHLGDATFWKPAISWKGWLRQSGQGSEEIQLPRSCFRVFAHIRRYKHMCSRICLRNRSVDYRVPHFGDPEFSLSVANEIGTIERDPYIRCPILPFGSSLDCIKISKISSNIRNEANESRNRTWRCEYVLLMTSKSRRSYVSLYICMYIHICVCTYVHRYLFICGCIHVHIHV